jgi:ubiquitin carboxyl-terminal hydrolase 10
MIMGAVIYHHGQRAGGGHYTCDILQKENTWLRIDDTIITPVTPLEVTDNSELMHADGRLPYILMYERQLSS